MSQTWGDIIVSSFQNTLFGVANILPEIIGALIIFLVGLLIAVVLAKLIEKIVIAIKLDQILERIGFKAFFEKAGLKMNSALFFSELIKWFLIIIFLIAAFNIVGLSEISLFLKSILYYIPRIIIVSIIIIAAALIANFVSKLIRSSVKAMGLQQGEFLEKITKITIYIFTSLIVLDQLGIASSLIKIVFTGIVAMAAIAGGLAFGLGGKELAKELLDKIKK